jgi:hypothetical protein
MVKNLEVVKARSIFISETLHISYKPPLFQLMSIYFFQILFFLLKYNNRKQIKKGVPIMQINHAPKKMYRFDTRLPRFTYFITKKRMKESVARKIIRLN